MKPSASLPFRSSRLLSAVILAVALVLPLHAAERAALKVLAIGNSFSQDAMAFLPALAKAGGKEIVATNALIGGCSFERHVKHLRQAEAGNPEGKAYKGIPDPVTGEKRDVSVVDLLTAQPWDVVTIQQWSQLSFKPETFQPFADELIAAIRKYAPTAEIVVHETWAYREDHDWFKKGDGFTAAKMYSGVRDTYRAFADGKGYRMIPVGDALDLARQTPRWTYATDKNFDFKNPPAGQLPDQRTSLNVGWQWKKNKDDSKSLSLDAIHCNTAGRYLGAAVWYQFLFNTSDIPVGFIPKGLTAEDTADLRTHALAAVKAERARKASLAVPAAAQ